MFSPQLVETRQSEFSGRLEVYKFQNKYFIKTGDVHQSGGWASTLFYNVFKKFDLFVGVGQGQPKGSPWRASTKILLLGFAGGTFAELLFKIYPRVQITGVDIDPVMIDLGKKYYQVLKPSDSAGKRDNLKIEIADAFVYIKQIKEKFDLIVVDLFKRNKVQIKTGDIIFLKDILAKTKDDGHIIINLLYLPEFRHGTDEYYEFLSKEEKKGDFIIRDIFQNSGNKVILLEKLS